MNAWVNEVHAYFFPPLFENNKDPSRVLVKAMCCICQEQRSPQANSSQNGSLWWNCRGILETKHSQDSELGKPPGTRVPMFSVIPASSCSVPTDNLLCLIILHMASLHRDAPSPSSLSAWLSVNGLACQILLIHSRRRDYTGMASVHLRNGAGPSQTTAISWDTLNENWLKEPCQVWGTGATKTKLFFWATRFWAIYYSRRTTSTK